MANRPNCKFNMLQRNPKYLERLFWGAFFLSIACIHFSPALSSIAVFTAILSSFLSLSREVQERRLLRFQGFAGLLFVSMFALDIGNGASMLQAWTSLQVMLPWFFLPILMVIPMKSNLNPIVIGLFLAFPLWWVSGATLLNYANDWKFLSQMVLESKPLPLYSQVYHIEFSLLITAVLLGMTLSFEFLRGSEYKVHFGALYALLFISLHIMSARTGLLGYWLGIGVFIWGKWSRNAPNRSLKPHYSWGIILVLILMLFQIPSLKNRIQNTKEDLAAVWTGGDVNHKSIGQRVQAWKATWNIAQTIPEKLMGVGSHQFDAALMESYEHGHTTLYASNRIGPHNQSLQWAASYGWLILGAWWLFIGWLLRSVFSGNHSWIIGLPLAAASMFESIAQRQAGALAVLILFVFMGSIEKYRRNIKNFPSIT